MSQYRVLIEANDEKGLVHKVSSIFYNFDLNILSNSEFVDKENNKFFMRSVVDGDVDLEELKKALKEKLPKSSTVRVISPKKKNIVIMATKELHALGDILIRHEAGELEANILAVVSNYDKLESLVNKFNIPYITISHENLDRHEHEGKIIECIDAFEEVDYIVLAKYMRILTPRFVETYEHKIINIHHSFLPAFIGANPYKQAYDRGVKIIGATAHFVNNNLDEGPIIAQEVIHVDHAYSWKDMQRSGKDVEKVVLSRALKLAIEDRIFVYANKTVIF
ncbi:MAG: formyltetrahydrofolate deformylase [Epsilonproteobacteria bacterium]|nr:formyltetrahydrofolate deformylase [Campylobacterota bacterium]OIO13186.1 MAG: formyltetrahydrofolate deformylase [Helicobacteraceae bacterium CG1_02_36_14]PIP09397.1 MAG: formyltetrahydrofolate deformylase [Sulfurimonas sp. CG23_combo_of_CG06-09_8_20_14_all_36_33]PIS26059.1 MAG: formyltetrahydrofolate deformylase [Sulfurimonas sp. CG08_land_8_20_14_0_20_36_33]PIU35324.1 MAG: formyltetrahydrofolate deformylase [Sulfurimonas sp. CG07_land_8_20_14_0_80_36_56]PIV02862.1 MAG: formyltetrahydrofo